MISRIFRIANHPLIYQANQLKERYVRALGCVLHSISKGHPNMRMLFEEWGYSIMQRQVSSWFDSAKKSDIKKAISINRNGFHFFRLKNQFYYDCFYLTEIFDPKLLNGLNEFLVKEGQTIFTKSALKRTANYFIDNVGELNVEDSLLNHRKENKQFAEKRESKVLVVATVSAGKSTLINALTGHHFNKVMNSVCTTAMCEIHNKVKEDGISLRHKEYISYSPDIDSFNNNDSSEVAFHFKSSLGTYRISILDTPGVNNSRDNGHFLITSNAIKSQDYDFVIFVSNGQYNGTNDEYRLLKLLAENTKRPILFVLNKLDNFKKGVDDIGKMVKDYKKELVSIGFKSPEVFPLSAQYAYLIRSEYNLDDDEIDELDLMRRRFSNPFLDLQSYVSERSRNEIEKSGIITFEQAIKNQLIH